MKRRIPSLLLAALLAVSGVGLAASPASADPPPWSAAYHKHHKHHGKHCRHPSHYDERYDYDGRYDRRVYRGRYKPVYRDRYEPVYGRGYGQVYGGGYDPVIYERCGNILNRVQKARAGLARWEGTGQHRKAVRAWRQLLSTAPRRMEQCRVGALRNDRYASAADWYDEDAYYDDGYFPGYGTSLDLKHQWPSILSGLLGQYALQLQAR